MAEMFDVVVVGLGAMGAATLYQLARAGVKVLGIDQYSPPHTLGSSHGESRITRAACAEGKIYTKLVGRSHQLWRQIESELRDAPGSLFTQNGQIVVGAPVVTSSHNVSDFVGTTERIALDAGIDHRMLSAEQMRSEYPVVAIGDDESAYLDALSGFVRPEACITAQLSLAQKFGATVRTGVRMTGFRSTTSGVEIQTDQGDYASAAAVLTMGPWLPPQLPASKRAMVQVTRQILYWFALKRPADLPKFQPERFPVFVWVKKPPRIVVYGFPALGAAGEGIKLATEQKTITTTPELVERSVSDAEKRTFFEDYVEPSFPALSDRCVRAEVCLYTDEKESARFLIDRHPDAHNVICVSACSGHGFKHSAAIGEIVAGMATNPAKTAVPEFAWNYSGEL